MSDVLTMLASGGGVAGAAAAVLTYVMNRGTLREGRELKAVQGLVRSEMEPLAEHRATSDVQLAQVTAQLTQVSAELGRLSDRQGKILDRLAVLETKIEVFWRNVAVDVARVLHSPNPARAHVDALLEQLIDGQLSSSQREELRELLTRIRDYHHGDPSEFPIYPGDQVAAAILLQTMDMSREGKR